MVQFECMECGASLVGLDRDGFRAHMIGHGYKVEMGTLFKSRKCDFCEKPALYRVSGGRYCKDHKGIGSERLSSNSTKPRDHARGELEQRRKESDAKLLNSEKLRRTKG